MNFRVLFFRLPIILSLFLCSGFDSFGLQERLIRISPILIKWNADAQMFRAYFDVTNDTSEDVELSSIIIFKIGKFRRWRGARIPNVKAKQTGTFKISFAPGIMLKNEYASITVNIYGKDYTGLIDYSSRYVKISSRSVIADGKTKIELLESTPKTVAVLPKTTETPQKETETPQLKKRLIDLGAADERPQLLATERFQNALLEQVTSAEKNLLAEEKDVKPPVVEPPSPPEMFTVTPGKFQNRLTWKPVADATAYNLYWGKSAELTRENGIKIENVESGFVHSDLNEAIYFHYILTAVKDGLESEPETEVAGKPIVPPQGAPQLTITDGDEKLLLSWTTVENATKYDLYWGTTPDVVPSDDNKIVLQGNNFEHTGLKNKSSYYYIIAAANSDGEGEMSVVSTGMPKPPPVLEASVSELMEGVQLDDFRSIKTDSALLVTISDANLEKEASLKRAEDLKALDISSRDKLIALYIAEGKSESVAKALSGQLSKEPENLNLSLSLSKVYHEQGDIKAALKVLNSSLNRISLSARIALNQELKTSVKKGESTLTTKSEEAYLADEFSKLGVSLLEKKKYIEALSAFSSLYSLSQDYPMVKYYLGLSRHGMKQYNQAKQLFVEQAQGDLKKKQLIDDLSALTLVLATTLDLPTIKNTRDQFMAMQQEENTPEEVQTIAEQVTTLDRLLAEAEKRRLAGLPDLRIVMSDDFDRAEIQSGQKILFAFTAMNFGKVKSEPFKVYYQFKHEQGMTFDIPSFDRFLALESKLAPDSKKASRSWEKELIIPDGVVPGKYQLIANVEQTEGKGEVTFDNNRAQSAMAISIIPPIADLKIGFISKMAPMPITSGQKIDLGLIVTNKGFKDSPLFEVDYFLEKEGGSTIDLKVSDKKVSVPKENKSITWKKQLTIPGNVSEGQYQIQVRIRVVDKAAELDNKNNTVASGFKLNYTPPYSDLALKFEQEPATQALIGGQSFSTGIGLENSGNAASAEGKVVYQLKGEKGSVILLKEDHRFSALKKDQPPIVVSRKFQLPEKFPKGIYQLVATVELDDNQLEKNLENNSIVSKTRLTITPSYSDLALQFLQEPVTQALVGGQTFSTQLRLENKGNTESTKGKVVYQLKDAQGGVTILEDDSFPVLKNDQPPMTLTREFQLPEKFPRGVYQITAKLELDDNHLETNFENNSIVSKNQLTIVPSYSDLGLTLEIEDREQPLTPGDSIIIKARLSNSGNRDTKDIEVSYYLKTRSGQEIEIPQADQIANVSPGSEKGLEKVILIPEDLAVGLYQIVAEAKMDDSEFEENVRNNNDRSPYIFSYVKPEPVEAPVLQATEEVQPVIEEDKRNNWLRHASAISLALGSAWQAQKEDKKFQDAKDRESELESQYGSSQTDAQVSIISTELENNRNQMDLYAQNTNLWGALALVGVGWEIYNIFFWSPDEPAAAQADAGSSADDSGSLISNKWMHASAISVTLLSVWQSQLEVKKYNDLSDENDDLNTQYQTANSAEEVANISNKISSNRTEMESHIANANIFDGVTLVALGLESYLLWKAFTGTDTESANLQFRNPEGFQLKPYFAYRKVGLNLNYTW
ncbi:MAG: hypothetical protein HOB38_26765 [Deltaproteobacteria bacterium]|nr:hypothetical protein [Deltaproteobacteria bacterium]